MRMTNSDIVMLRGNHSRAVAEHRLIRVKRGVGILPPKHGEALPRWEAFSIAAQARILAVARTMRREVMFTRESAMLLHGLPCWALNPDVSIRVDGSFTPSPLPEIVIGGHRIPAVRIRSTCGVYAESEAERIGGLLADPLEESALQMALKTPPVDAVVAVSAIIRALSRFDRFRQSEGRRREAMVKERLSACLAALGAAPGKHQARAVLAVSDAGCESVGERALLFTLATAFAFEIRSQYEVVIHGHSYFLDFAIPSLKIAFEFDGLIKMGNDHESFRRAQRALLARQRELEDAGWVVIRIGWEELMDPAGLREKLIERVSRCSAEAIIGPPAAGEALWNRHLSLRGINPRRSGA